MSKRVCSGPDPDTRCPRGALVTPPKRRCAECGTQYERGRGTRQQRGYDAAHDKLRAQYQRRMDAGEVFTCWRCPRTIDPSAWHLGHDDHDRSKYRGPECIPCNLATSGRRISPGA